jgi:25S rRNA (adenine2142-N1)-methyltransferase
MGFHRKTIRRKKPLTHEIAKGVKRREAIKRLHTDLKSTKESSIPIGVYQQASSKGQDIQRGGDSSRILLQWLQNFSCENIRVLEVGCLDAENAISKHLMKDSGSSIHRIDLKSRDPRIQEQDFMTLDNSREVCPWFQS